MDRKDCGTDSHFHLKNSHFGHRPMSTTRWKCTFLNSGLMIQRRNSWYLGGSANNGARSGLRWLSSCAFWINRHKHTFWWKGMCQTPSWASLAYGLWWCSSCTTRQIAAHISSLALHGRTARTAGTAA